MEVSKRVPETHVAVVGAGPGGLTAAMMLAAKGFRVTVFEKRDRVGGRNSEIALGPYRFDVGPTFLMMKFILDEVFEQSGLKCTDFMDCVPLDPMYRLQWHDDTHLDMTSDHDAMRAAIAEAFPGQEAGFDKYLRKEKVRFDRMLPCLQKPYSTAAALVSLDLLKALPRLSIGRSLYGFLGRYFSEDRLKLSFTFQSKYLGMSPWECPAAFAILSYVEHAFGVYHVMGGLNRISHGLARAAEQMGATIRLNAPVRKVLAQGRRAVGLELENGEKISCDEVVLNADFGHAMTALMPEGRARKYTPERVKRMRYSCSTFMLYLGLDKLYDVPHHTILFPADYRRNVEDIFVTGRVPEGRAMYIRNASVTDPDLAPEGHSAVYVLVPVPNLAADIDWSREKSRYRDSVLELIAGRTPMTDIREHIREERVLTPEDWQSEYDVFMGATFNLAHTLGQMLYFRPHNEFDDFDHCYLVGGGTHPGSGVPTIIESGRIAADLIADRYRTS